MAKRPPEPEPAEAGMMFIFILRYETHVKLFTTGLSRVLELLSFLVVVLTFPVSLFFTLKTTKVGVLLLICNTRCVARVLLLNLQVLRSMRGLSSFDLDDLWAGPGVI